MDDTALVTECLDGRQEAWAALVDRHGPRLLSVARRCGLKSDEAEDVVQEVFLAAWRHLPRLREADRLRGWLTKAASRKAWRMRHAVRRREDRERAVPTLPSASESPEAAVIHAERVETVWGALRALGEVCRSLLQMLFQHPTAKYADVAATLDMPVGSIGPRRRRCLSELMRTLAVHGFEISVSEVPASGSTSVAESESGSDT